LAPPSRLKSANKRKDSAPSLSNGKARNRASQERIMKYICLGYFDQKK
jgi:hypothetical protein